MKLSDIAIVASACAAISATVSADVVKVVSFTDLAEWHDAPTNPDLGLFPTGWAPVFNTEDFTGVSVPGAQHAISGGTGWSAWTATGSTKDGVVSKGSGIAAAASATERQALVAYGHAMGLACQVVDDVLDVTADTVKLGKTAGKDAASNKPTYVALMGLSQAQAFAGELHQFALDAVAPLGDSGRLLAGMADFIVLRDH